jgi:hypothetical protein
MPRKTKPTSAPSRIGALGGQLTSQSILLMIDSPCRRGRRAGYGGYRMRDHLVGYGGVRQRTEHAARAAQPWVERWGRLGYAAHGVVYALIGILALQAALGIGGDITDTEGALVRIIAAPYGRLLLGAIALGLVGYATWRFVQAALDSEDKGADPKGLLARGGYAVSGVVHLGLAWFAARLILGTESASGGGDQAAQERIAWLLSLPVGAWLVALVGAIVVAVGGFQLYKAYRADFHRQLETREMSGPQQRWALQAGRLGAVARGVVFGIIGGFLIVAAIQAEPGQARGLGGALAIIAEEPAGPSLLGVVAAGLLAYGFFELVKARFGRMVAR